MWVPVIFRVFCLLVMGFFVNLQYQTYEAMQDRVCFLSKDDLFVGHHLEMAEKRIREVSEKGAPIDLEGVVELWHIKRMMENDSRLIKWTDAEYEELQSSTSGYNAIIAKFFNSLNHAMIKSEFELLGWTYKKTFWEIIDAFKLYGLIEPEILREIISENINYLRVVLKCKGLVERFKDVIRVNPNVNYVRLITLIKDDGDKIRVSPKTRLLAERLEKKLNEDMLSDFFDR